MSSLQCPNCKVANWVQAVACKSCGYAFECDLDSPLVSVTNRSGNDVAGGRQVYAAEPPGAYQSYTDVGPAGQLRSGLAVASLTIGIVSVATAIFLVGLALAPVALVLGIVALVKASRHPFVYAGRGFAIAGIITSSVALVFFLPLVAAVAIPNLLAAKRAANESSAISELKTLFAAEATYMATAGSGSCGDLNALAKTAFIKPEMAVGVNNEYRFEIVIGAPGKGCELFATPVSRSGGTRSFMVAQDGVIRAAKRNGSRADKDDPPLSN